MVISNAIISDRSRKIPAGGSKPFRYSGKWLYEVSISFEHPLPLIIFILPILLLRLLLHLFLLHLFLLHLLLLRLLLLRLISPPASPSPSSASSLSGLSGHSYGQELRRKKVSELE